jgi:O-acetyl-ADP-ribose deacetylase (regulator of RNase III)
MKVDINGSVLELIDGDITKQDTVAIANAANASLAGGGGVDGAIHKAGGPTIMQELNEKYSGCPTGSAVITGAGDLKAKYVIHAVGPRFKDDHRDEELLRSAYQCCLDLCKEHNIESISFPSISTGIYGFPIKKASIIALDTVSKFLERESFLKLARFVLFGEEDYLVYANTAKELVNGNFKKMEMK